MTIVKPSEDWEEILAPLNTMEAKAKRILRDVIHYQHDRAYEKDDIAQVASAIRAINAELLAALEWAYHAWENGGLKNEDGETPDFDPVRNAIAKTRENA